MDPVTLSNLSFWLNIALLTALVVVVTRDAMEKNTKLALLVLFMVIVFIAAPISWARNMVADAISAQEEDISEATSDDNEVVVSIPLNAINEIPVTPNGIPFRF